MFDDLERLRTKTHLLQLLMHYADLAAPDREAWQDRVMVMEGLGTAEISKLHGELIAFNWIAQNTGNSPGTCAGVVPACYRVTLAGLRAVQAIQSPEAAELPEISEEQVVTKHTPRRKKQAPVSVAS
jgi:hypothetical protein